MSHEKHYLYWLSTDLRMEDNHAISYACQQADTLDIVYTLNIDDFKRSRFNMKRLAKNKWNFIKACLADLHQHLKAAGQHIHLLQGDPLDKLTLFIQRHRITHFICQRPVGWDEVRMIEALTRQFPTLMITFFDQNTLFSDRQLLQTLGTLPATFSAFNRRMGAVLDEMSQHIEQYIQPYPQGIPPALQPAEKTPGLKFSKHDEVFRGGESNAQLHLMSYFQTSSPSCYQQTRNELDDWHASTKFSPWLAQGSISPRQILATYVRYQRKHPDDDQSKGIIYELMWREYFQWYAREHGKKLFTFSGITETKPLTTFHSERFEKWCQGTTPWPIVNACMHQLMRTGYLSNRARQIAASCLINELECDWRYGAAWFEQQLIDYDVASNWGNWQYIAGVGCDPRGGRHFNLDKQTEQYDPDQRYIRRWDGQPPKEALDSRDAADWPHR